MMQKMRPFPPNTHTRTRTISWEGINNKEGSSKQGISWAGTIGGLIFAARSLSDDTAYGRRSTQPLLSLEMDGKVRIETIKV